MFELQTYVVFSLFSNKNIEIRKEEGMIHLFEFLNQLTEETNSKSTFLRNLTTTKKKKSAK